MTRASNAHWNTQCGHTVVATRQELQLLSLIVDGASPYRSPEKTEEPVSIHGIALPPSFQAGAWIAPRRR
jgi:hypothetical protein